MQYGGVQPNTNRKPPSSARVLVLGSDTLSFLAVIRSLGRRGIEVHAISPDPACLALRSRYVRAAHPLPNFTRNTAEWLDGLQALFTRVQFDLVIPCDDPHILRLSTYVASGRAGPSIELMPDALRRVTSSKEQCHKLARELGIPVAPSTLVRTPEELRHAIHTVGRRPIVLRPVMSFSATDTDRRQEVRKAFSESEAITAGEAMLAVSELQIQQNFIGRGTGVEFLASHGEILVAFQHVRVHEPLHGGGSSYRKAIAVEPRMLAAAAALVRALDYDGVGMCEFKWNNTTDAFVFIELNARFWGSLALAVASGADFPWFLFQYRMYGARSFPKDIRTDLYCRHLTLDINWIVGNARNDRRDPLLATLPWSTVATELFNVLRGRERIDSLAVDDPRPFFAELHALLKACRRKVRNKLLVRSHSLGWVRRRGAGRVRALLTEAKTIEVVCYGNICRSPMAAALLREYLPANASGRVINSGGFHPKENRECPPLAILVAQQFAIDLTRHRSTRITAERVERADLILVADFQNLWLMREQFPNAAGKTFLLGVADFDHPIAIADPWGGSIEVFQHAYARIKAVCETLLEET